LSSFHIRIIGILLYLRKTSARLALTLGPRQGMSLRPSPLSRSFKFGLELNDLG
jgi:hypothetical protein